MHPFVLVPLLSCVAAAAMASAILFRDPGQRANRLVALVLVCSAHWSLCEVLWNIQDDPAWVLRLIKLSSFGWLWLGPLTLDIFTEIEGNVRSRRRKLVPLAYASAAASIVLYVATPWCLAEPARTSWGWARGPNSGAVSRSRSAWDGRRRGAARSQQSNPGAAGARSNSRGQDRCGYSRAINTERSSTGANGQYGPRLRRRAANQRGRSPGRYVGRNRMPFNR